MPSYHLAQINIARMLAPIDGPIMAEGVLRDRKRWFEKFDGPYTALWWVPVGHIPSTAEAGERLDYLREHGNTAHAFLFQQLFPELSA